MYRIRGTVKLTGVIKKFTIIIGDDGVEYFAIPSLFRHPHTYPCLKEGAVIEFEPKATVHGWRVFDATVLSLTAKDSDAHGEEVRL
jgi:hypothetical protein